MLKRTLRKRKQLPFQVKPGIDYEKLKSIGVPDEVIASLDPRDGGNITPQGEVLFLDEGRLHRRELPDKPLHENHPRGWESKTSS